MPDYTTGQPAAGQAFRVSRPLIANNFDSIADALANDHVAVTDPSSSERVLHKFVTLNDVQASDPTPTYPQSVIYSKQSGTTPNRVEELYWVRQNESGVTQVAPISPLALARFDAAGALAKAYNVTSVTASTGDFTVNFSTTLVTGSYIPNISVQSGTPLFYVIAAQSSTSVQIKTYNTSGTLTNPANVSVSVWGF